MYKKTKIFLLCAVLAGAITVQSATLEQAKAVYNRGDYAKALPMMMEQHKKSPKNGSVSYWLGVCLYMTGEKQESIKYFEYAASRNVAEAYRYLAILNYDNYDFDAAEEAIDEYEAALTKAKKPLDESDEIKASITKAKMMLEHVEKIVIIDSIDIDKDKFLLAYNMSASCGSLGNSQMLPDGFERRGVSLVHVSESGEKMLWAKSEQEGGKSGLYEAVRLIQGWDDAVKLDESLSEGGNAAYPFMMQDGVTVYFACDSENSLGGFDIFMTRKDVETGEFYKPQNIGMPYNSPYNDYMLAIDEEKNVGWWATDRNQIPDKVTVYAFIPNPSRINYRSDDPDIASKALITSYRDTWGDEDYSDIAEKMRTVNTNAITKIKDFAFHVYNGVVYRSFGDFKTTSGVQMMEELLVMQKRFTSNKERLGKLRNKYHNASATERQEMRNNILQLENLVEKSRQDIEVMENSIRKIENN